MTAYDDAETSCPMCTKGLDAADLCEHEDPMCSRCCGVNHREQFVTDRRRELDERMWDALRDGWSGVA